MLCFRMNPAAVVTMSLYSDPHGFQKLKQNATNAAQYIFNVIKGSVLTIAASHHKLTSKKNQKKQYMLRKTG